MLVLGGSQISKVGVYEKLKWVAAGGRQELFISGLEDGGDSESEFDQPVHTYTLTVTPCRLPGLRKAANREKQRHVRWIP